MCDELVSQIDLFPTLAAMAGAADARPSLPSSARDLGPALRGQVHDSPDAIFFEQEETRAIRTHNWLYAMRFRGAGSYPMSDELYHLATDPLERTNLIELPEQTAIADRLRDRVSSFFDTHSEPRFDLWRGGSAKSNVTYDQLWKDAWGEDWAPEFSGA
ncbi:MAG: hypothetical protein F4145_06785 [Boseongicola sp. SB0675_bin_26]|nr:hypothetical protein [Boseongicola sp. SB0675_bin_26]